MGDSVSARHLESTFSRAAPKENQNQPSKGTSGGDGTGVADVELEGLHMDMGIKIFSTAKKMATGSGAVLCVKFEGKEGRQLQCKSKGNCFLGLVDQNFHTRRKKEGLGEEGRRHAPKQKLGTFGEGGAKSPI